MLIGVSGVGPKAALAILSATTPQNLALSIVTEDEKALTAAQGIGKKIAQRIILELKDKLAKEQSSFTVPVSYTHLDVYKRQVLDCDAVYHQALREDEALRRRIRDAVGEVFRGTELDRQKLGSLV